MEIYIVISGIDGFTINGKFVHHFTIFAKSKSEALEKAKDTVDEPDSIYYVELLQTWVNRFADKS